MKNQISRLLLNKFKKHQFSLPLYNPAADFEWIRFKSQLPWLHLNIQIPYSEILKEIKNSPVEYEQHRDDYAEHCGWLSGCLHGKSWTATREENYYNDNRPYIWTDESNKYFSFTQNYFKNQWPATNYQRLRIMLLEPNGYISVHKDYDISKLSAINIAITNPDKCHFVFEKHGIVPFKPGNAFWLDLSNYHTVFNDSDEKRWHIIVHQDLGDLRFQNLVVKSYHTMYNKDYENSHNHNPRRS